MIEPALAEAGLRLDDVHWILATHGHFDHIGGAYAIRERIGTHAETAIHVDDAALLRDRGLHLPSYAGIRFRFLDDPAALAQTDAMLMENISGELAVDRALGEGDRIDLGDGLVMRVVHTPGHCGRLGDLPAGGVRLGVHRGCRPGGGQQRQPLSVVRGPARLPLQPGSSAQRREGRDDCTRDIDFAR